MGTLWRLRLSVRAWPQNNQLMSKRRVLSFKPQLRLEWRGQNGQTETEQPDHSASLGDFITSSSFRYTQPAPRLFVCSILSRTRSGAMSDAASSSSAFSSGLMSSLAAMLFNQVGADLQARLAED